MSKPKQLLLQIPEYYLAVIVLLAGYSPPFSFHPLALGLAILPLLQIVFKNKVSGLIMGSAFLLVNLVMLGALISELSEFTAFTHRALQLLIGGLTIWLVNSVLSLAMVYKYSTAGKEDKRALA